MTVLRDVPQDHAFPKDIAAVVGPAAAPGLRDAGAAFRAQVGDTAMQIYAAPERCLETPDVFACFCGMLSDRDGRAIGKDVLTKLAGQIRDRDPDPDQLRGNFALIVYDKRRRSLHSIRDAIGIERLWLTDGTTRIVASSLLQLRHLRGIGEPFALDEEVFQDAWERGYVHPGRSVFQGVHQQPIGSRESFFLDDNQCVSADFRPAVTAPETDLTPAAAAEQVRDRLSASLRRLGVARTKTTVLFSGGVDSTLIAALLAGSAGSAPIDGRCVGALVPIWGDEFYARYAAWKLGLPMRTLRPGPTKVAEPLLHAAGRIELPIFDRALVAASLLARDARDGGSALILTGDCADGLFMGQSEAERWIRSPGDPPSAPGDTVASGPPLAAWLSPWGASAPNSAVGNLGAKLRGLGRAYGIDSATPFLDWDLMCLARSLPPEILLRDMRSKALLKDALIGWPGWFVDRRKIGFLFNDKWIWQASNFEGLRESVTPEAFDLVGAALDPGLRDGPGHWSRSLIRRHYHDCLKLLVTSRWLSAYGLAPSHG